jgi:choice-of-anchor A domain-containing protein
MKKSLAKVSVLASCVVAGSAEHRVQRSRVKTGSSKFSGSASLTHFRTAICTLALSMLSLGADSVFAASNALGLDSSLNLLTFSDFSVPSGDVEGRVAVGGNAIISGYSINTPSHYSGTALTVAGSLSFAGGSIHGNTLVGGNLTSSWGGSFLGTVSVGGNLDASKGISATGVTVWGSAAGYPQSGTPDLVKGAGSFNLGLDFAAEKTRLTSLSIQIASQTVTGKVLNDYGNLLFKASNSNGINIFDIAAADASRNMTISGLGAAGTVIINIRGSDVNFASHGFSGFDNQVLFNLPDAKTLKLGYVNGSILAPNAAVSGTGGLIVGQVVANSWNSSIQVNDAAFAGSIPVTSVPEPESWAMLIAGLGLTGLIARRKKTLQAA